MRNYSPFDKSINDLQTSDLAVLRDVSEGWYVEYKSQVPKGIALAKAISALANTYGGWLFLGIEEKSKDEPVAGSFPGIPNGEVESTLQRLRQSTNAHLNPIPHFESKVLRGPCSQIELADEASIVAVEVPQSHTTPHIHKDGRIYRRVADSSEPKFETDRFMLDQLWRRADPIREKTRRWVENDPEFSEAEAKMPYLRLLLCADPWRQRSPWLNAPLHEIRSLFSRQVTGLPSAPFKTFYTTAKGFIARQAEGNDPHDYVMTWKIQRDLSSEVIFPLQLYSPSQNDGDVKDLMNYEHGTDFLNVLSERNYTQPRIADLNLMMTLLLSAVSQYRSLLRLASAEQGFFCKARILNSWRVLPFFDSKAILKEYKEHGLPMILDQNMTIPTGNDPDSFFSVDHLAKSDDEPVNEAVSASKQAFVIFALIATALGVPVLFEGKEQAGTKNNWVDELFSVGERARTVQEKRNERRRRP